MNGDLIDRQTAKQNLNIIVHDRVADLAGLQAGWCWAFAPLRSFLTNPLFLKSLRKYKARQCTGGAHHFNIDFLKTFFRGQENLDEVRKCLWIVHLLCRATDANGKITEPRLIYDMVHEIFPMNDITGPEETLEFLSVCNSIMTESLSAFKYEPIFYQMFNNNALFAQLEQKLENGEVLTLGDGTAHVFNIFKKNGNYYTLSPYQQFANSRDAITSWGQHGINLYYLSPISLEHMYYDAVHNRTAINRQLVADSLNGNNYSMSSNQKNPVEEINEIADGIKVNTQAYRNSEINEDMYNIAINQLIERMDTLKNANRNNPDIVNLASRALNAALSAN